VPSAQVSPNVPRAVAVALAAALVLSFGLALLLDAIDNTVKTQEDVEQNLGLTLLDCYRPSIQKRTTGPAPP
jgi:capsular polysaccharide biosynthesis protein